VAQWLPEDHTFELSSPYRLGSSFAARAARRSRITS
jgi:hypothetical protein